MTDADEIPEVAPAVEDTPAENAVPEGAPTDAAAPEGAPEEDEASEDALFNDQADSAEDFLNGLLDVLDMDGEAVAEIEGDAIVVDITGPDLGILIGRHGATLEALQEMTRAAVQHQTSARARLVLDVGGYRQRQREMLERRARAIAAKVCQGGRPVELEPMSAYERKAVHNALVSFPGVKTHSEGEDPDRRIVISPS